MLATVTGKIITEVEPKVSKEGVGYYSFRYLDFDDNKYKSAQIWADGIQECVYNAFQEKQCRAGSILTMQGPVVTYTLKSDSGVAYEAYVLKPTYIHVSKSTTEETHQPKAVKKINDIGSW